MHALGMRPARSLIGVFPVRPARIASVVWIVLAADFAFPGYAAAEDREYSTVGGEPIVIARHSQWNEDCTPNGLPSIKIDRIAANGITSLSAGTSIPRGNSVRPERTQCLGKEMPAAVLSYRPKPDFIGTDTVSYTVTLNGSRKVTNSVTINVLPSSTAAGEQLKKFETASAAPDPANVATPRTTQPAGEVVKSATTIDTDAPVARPATVTAGARIALVIGNAGYKNVPALQNPTRDADNIASALRSAGFKTVLLKRDLTRETLTDALQSFAAEAEKADWAVVYFAGHGLELNGTNYLIPVDARLSTDRDVEFEAVPLDRVMSAVGGAKRLRLVMLDACRDNPFVNQMRRSVATRSIGRGLTNVEPEAGTLVVFAAKHGQVALDGDGASSPFVAALIKRMKTPGLEIRRLFDHVRDDVLQMTQRRQQPFSYGSLPGSEDYYFRAATAAAKRP